MGVTTGSNKKKSVFDSIKGAFIQEQPGMEDQDEAAPTTRAVPANSAFAPIAQPVLRDTSGDEKAKKTLLEAIEANSLDSYDYLKFKTSVQALAADIPDEKLRFKTVFATAKAMSVSKDKLVQTAQHYITVLDQELKKFDEAVSEQVDARITAGETKVKSLEDNIASKQEQIQKLTDDINLLTQERATLVAKITDDKATIDSRRNSFVAAHGTMVQEINKDIAKMSEILG
jgi:chromosome segregation ATPase